MKKEKFFKYKIKQMIGTFSYLEGGISILFLYITADIFRQVPEEVPKVLTGLSWLF